MKNEAVHKIHSWDDLKKRLTNNKKCFALFHESDPLHPLAFVFSALTDQIAQRMQVHAWFNQRT